MALAAYFILDHSIKDRLDTSHIINISGKQRALSQQIAFHSLQLSLASPEEETAIRQRLRELIIGMENSHNTLLHGGDTENHHDSHDGHSHSNHKYDITRIENVSPELQKIYFDPPFQLEKKLHDYLVHAKKLVDTPTIELLSNNENLEYILANRQNIFSALDKAVAQYELESEQRIETFQKIQQIVLVSILAILLFEVIFIFRPVMRNMVRRTREQKLRENVLAAANDANSIDETFTYCLEEICRYTSWPVGHIYVYDKKEEMLVSSGNWHIVGEGFEEFRRITEETSFTSGVGLPGRVLQRREPVWIIDVSKDKNFPRNKFLKNLPVKGAFAFPFFSGKNVIAVAEFFTTGAKCPDAYIMSLVDYIGVHISRVMEHAGHTRMLEEEVERRTGDFVEESRRSQLLYEIVTTTNDADTVEESIQECVTQICRYADWPVGHAYIYRDERNLLEPGNLWYCKDDMDIAGFRENTASQEFHPGEGLPGMILETGEAFTSNDFFENGNFPRAVSARENSLQSCFAFPITVNDKVEVVLEFFDNKDIEASDELMKLMSTIGAQLGAVIKRKQARMETEKARDDAEIATRSKSEFLANMSHELRTPLNSMLILAENLAENPESNLTEEQVEDASVILGSGRDLLTLINEILDLAKVESGKMAVNVDDIRLAELGETVRRNFAAIAERKQLFFNVEVAEGVPEIIRSDKMRIEQIMRNLISNAMKFTHEGGITLKISRPASDMEFFSSDLQADSTIAFAVSDTGIGIPKEKLGAIFESFQQADGSTSRKYGGTGLGLSISREFSQLLGGEVGVESQENEGSTFTLYLPEEIEVEEQQVDEEDKQQVDYSLLERILNQVPLATSHITDDKEEVQVGDDLLLIVEDDMKFAKILREAIHARGMKCLVAEKGMAGLQLVSMYKPKAIILDIELPDITGMELFELIQQDPEVAKTPVYFMSIHDEKVKAISSGAIGYLTKPVSKEQLDMALNKIEAMSFNAVEKMLIVEDDPSSASIIAVLAEKHGIEVIAATTAKDALAELKNNKFDCAVLDVVLPDMNGIELLEVASSDDEIKLPPLIVYSGREVSEEELTKISSYTDTFIQKNGESAEHIIEKMFETVNNATRKLDDKPVAKSKGKKQPNIVRENRKAMLVERNFPVQEMVSGSTKQDDTVAESAVESDNEGWEEIREEAVSTPSVAEGSDDNIDGRFSDKKVLLVDDDIRNIYAVSKMLKRMGSKVLIADNGKKALDLLAENGNVEIVLMDIMMPIMDGYQAIEAIRKQEQFESLPVIAVTAKAMKEDQEKCMLIGASDYLSKPLGKDKLVEVMEKWLKAA